jgi:hypothetical protein
MKSAEGKSKTLWAQSGRFAKVPRVDCRIARCGFVRHFRFGN